MTRKAFTERVGYSFRYIVFVENGYRAPTSFFKRCMADYFKLPVKKIFPDTGKARFEMTNNVRQLRKQRHKTLEDIQLKTDISYSYLSKVERGKRMPSFRTQQKLAEYFNVSVKRLFRVVIYE